MGYFSRRKVGIVPDGAGPADRIRRNLTRLDNLSVAPPLILQRGDGSVALTMDGGIGAFWAKVSGPSSPYGWAEAKRQPGGTWTACCRTGGGNAYEVNDVAGLGNTYQYLIPDGVGGYRFEAVRKGSSACMTTIVATLLDLAGKQDFPCGGPGDVFYEISGTSSSGTSIDIKGQTTVSSPTYNLVLSLDGTTLPEGSYRVHVFTKSAICGQAYGADGRFDGTANFNVVCPSTKVSMNVQSNFDVTTIVSSFGISGCGAYWYLDGLPQGITLNVSASIGGTPTICNTQVLPFENNGFLAGNVAVHLKIFDYNPFTVTFNASGSNVIPSSEVRIYTSCGSYTNDWQTAPYVFYDQVPLVANSVCTGYPGQFHGGGVEGATVSCTGGLTVSGTTKQQGYQGNSTVPRWAAATASAYVYPKTGVTADQQVWNWTVSYPAYFQDASYNSTDYSNATSEQQYYGGTVCPLGGDTGNPIDSKACCGCNLPANKTLHASALGQSFDITWDGYQWSGFFTADLHALTCPPPPGKQVPTEGQVTCHLYFEYFAAFQGSGGFRPFMTLQYASTGGNGPTLCPRTQPPANTQNQGWDLFEVQASYGQIYFDAVCPPSFYAEEKYVGAYGVNRSDGTGIYDYYYPEIDIIITE